MPKSKKTAAPAAPAPLVIESAPIDSLTLDPANLRLHPAQSVEAIKGSLARFGQQKPIVVGGDGVVVAGNGTVSAARALGWSHRSIVRTHLTGSEAVAFAIADNRTAEVSEWDGEALAKVVAAMQEEDPELTAALGFSEEALAALVAGGGVGGGDGEEDANTSTPPDPVAANATLAERFGLAPFTVLNARQGWWQERKRAWLALGLESHRGRGADLFLGVIDDEKFEGFGELGRTSIFDPVLCEIAYRWFSPPNGRVLDPFAGGSVRGIVAARLGRDYIGVDLRDEQVVENRVQFERFEKPESAPITGSPIWITGDSTDPAHFADLAPVDLVFSCPPYADLEVYSDDPADLSTMSYDDFLVAYRAAIANACGALADDRFAVFVVGDIRDRDGLYRSFPADTIDAFRAAGLALYNEAILVTPLGSVPVRAPKQFSHSRKLGKTHQNILVFVKGDPVKATAALGDVEFGEIGVEADSLAASDSPDAPTS